MAKTLVTIPDIYCIKGSDATQEPCSLLEYWDSDRDGGPGFQCRAFDWDSYNGEWKYRFLFKDDGSHGTASDVKRPRVCIEGMKQDILAFMEGLFSKIKKIIDRRVTGEAQRDRAIRELSEIMFGKRNG